MSSRKELANAIRALSMDAVQKAKSGHPGAPMGMADIAEVLWNDFMQHNPANPNWANRDRFVLSNGHGSMLIYSLLHLTGYDLSIEDLKEFRQLHSRTPGHPEYGYAPGVETTTGPLGQGITNGVGMALAEKILADQFNKPGHEIVDHNTYVFLGDGCLMEGISHESCSLAGALGLGKLIAFYDDNNISIDGEVRGHGDTPAWFLDDTPKRFEAYGWHVIPKVDGHDPEALKVAIEAARAVSDKPTLICCQTIIGYGSPNKQGKEECHGAPLGDDEIALTREKLGWSHPPFEIPKAIYEGWDAKARGADLEKEWNQRFAAYKSAHPSEAAEFERRMAGELPADFDAKAWDFIKEVDAKAETIATRKASQNALNGFGPLLPELLGGSADLAGSNLTIWKGCKGVGPKDASGNYIYYGVREFGMSAIMNGLTLHGGFKPYGATFLMFMEYARNAVRMAALMKINPIFVYTHDSIGLGEDGPTHQPVEQVSILRLTPRLSTWRPCDAVESAVAWKCAIERQGAPSALIFSRQNAPHMSRTEDQLRAIEKGGYVLRDCEGTPDAIIIGTGTEVELAVAACESLSAKGRKVRVVSMPSMDTFEAQDDAYKAAVLPDSVQARVAVEAGVSNLWPKYIGLHGKVIGVDTFGESAPAGDVYKAFGVTAEAVAAAVESLL
ncbi:Transketolase 1 [Thiorhodovibrio winogradskyi]|uniref:Transketolase n=1 Tax=Thiorhodovibrio winogradskyi TaxID=77007 RepID=A0ABZ0SD41_9GAMM|nr:transketolase [Thiorhodovibrio winogradskyi]